MAEQNAVQEMIRLNDGEWFSLRGREYRRRVDLASAFLEDDKGPYMLVGCLTRDGRTTNLTIRPSSSVQRVTNQTC